MIITLPAEDISLTRKALESFFREGELPGELNFEHLREFWESAIRSSMGAIFAAQHGMEVVGLLGGLSAICPITAQREIVEIFWYVLPQHRKTPIAIKLLRRFEDWGIEQGAVRVKMIHLARLNPIEVESMYQRMGYQLLEKGYYKNL